ncbi:MAG: hypothetical protein AB3N24_18975 [Leisingera sp.]
MPRPLPAVQLQGRRHDALYAVHEALISRQGLVWYLDRKDRLRAITAEPVFTAEGISYLAAPEGMEQELRLAVPRSGYLSGARAKPRIISEPLPDASVRAFRAAEGAVQ